MRLPARNGTPVAPAMVGEELVGVDGELVVETVARRGLGRRDEIAHEAIAPVAERPAPAVVYAVGDAHQKPRPPRPQEFPRSRPQSFLPFGLPVTRI